MVILYQKGDVIRLRRVDYFADPMDWGMDADEYARVLKAQEDGELFTVTCEASEGYYDLKSQSTDLELFAVCQYHFLPAAADWQKQLDVVDL